MSRELIFLSSVNNVIFFRNSMSVNWALPIVPLETWKLFSVNKNSTQSFVSLSVDKETKQFLKQLSFKHCQLIIQTLLTTLPNGSQHWRFHKQISLFSSDLFLPFFIDLKFEVIYLSENSSGFKMTFPLFKDRFQSWLSCINSGKCLFRDVCFNFQRHHVY